MGDASPVEEDSANNGAPKSRDAANTRLLLLTAARRRFAHDGYTSTTVRDIAADAGVNVALISRYFDSKEGLFEACLTRVADELGRDRKSATIAELADAIVSQLVGSSGAEYPLQLLLLVRSSGDERAESIRRKTLEYFAQGMARVAGWNPDEADSEHLILRAQIALSATMGMVLLRANSGLEPLSSAGPDDLTAPLNDVLTALLAPKVR